MFLALPPLGTRIEQYGDQPVELRTGLHSYHTAPEERIGTLMPALLRRNKRFLSVLELILPFDFPCLLMILKGSGPTITLPPTPLSNPGNP